MTNLFQRILSFFLNKNSLRGKIFKITGFFPIRLSIYKLSLKHIANERLEFLGDAVLSSVVSHYLFKKYPEKNEGFLTYLHSRITNRNMLNGLCSSIGLNHLVECDNKKRTFTYVYGNALEAFIAAIYIDKGYETCYKFVVNKLIDKHLDLEKLIKIDNNYKGRVIVWSQKEGQIATFEAEQMGGKFLSKLYINSKLISEGIGPSKKVASQLAAKQACRILHIS